MAGGIIQIVAYGTEDLFMTGNPEITFFKVVYRRHTNFALESIELSFDDGVAFGQRSSVVIPKNGDLIHRLNLSVDLPLVQFEKGGDAGTSDSVTIDDATQLAAVTDPTTGTLTVAQTRYYAIKDFMAINLDAYRKAKIIYESSNDEAVVENMIDAIDNVFQPIDEIGDEIETIINTYNSQLVEDEIGLLSTSSMHSIANSYNPAEGSPTVDRDTLMTALDHGVANSIEIRLWYYRKYEAELKKKEELESSLVEFAWIKKIGHALIDQVEVEIGGQVIDRQYGHWLEVWHQLTQDQAKEPAYQKMIGDVEVLTVFDRAGKPVYRLNIPLQFWFCRHNGLALPLIALEYHDVIVNVTFKRLEQLAYVENDRLISLSGVGNDLFLDEIGEDNHLPLSATLETEYVYLDTDERKRFAQVSHEYLIEQLTTYEFPNISLTEVFERIDAIHPAKEIIWTAQKDSFVENLNGFTECRWDNYSLNTDGSGRIITHTELGFHGYVRSPMLDTAYYNYLQPRAYHHATPSDGINVFSFGLMPEEYQPAGSANMSRLSDVSLRMIIDPAAYEGNSTITIRVYLITYNILRFAGGMAGVAYTSRT